MDHIPGCQGNSPGLHPAFDHPRISWPGKGMRHRPNPYSDGSYLFDRVLTFSPCQRPKWSSKDFCDLCSKHISSEKCSAYCTYLAVCDVMGDKLRYIILISITGKFSRKVGSLLLH